MSEKVKALLIKYREQWSYLIVGVLTTVINYLIYTPLVAWIPFFQIHYNAANLLAWSGAVAFAYFANGTWVYRTEKKRSLGEAGAFVLSRVFSLVLETVLLTLLIEVLHVNKLFAKLVVSVITVIVNYLTGLLVFKKQDRNRRFLRDRR